VVQSGSSPPVISWTRPSGSSSGTVAGYNVSLATTGGSVQLNQNLLSATSFTDTGYTGDERTYIVTAVDDNGVSSLGRSITLSVLQAVLKDGETLKRGIMNRLEFTVSSGSASRVEHVRLKVAIGTHTGLSEEVSVAPEKPKPFPSPSEATPTLPTWPR